MELKLRAFGLFFKGFDPDQPRVPAGQPDGGQWTDEGGGSADGSFQIAQASPRGGGRGGGTGFGLPFPDATPAQQTRLAVSQSAADAAVARVQKVDIAWRPPTGLYQTVEGAIIQNNAVISAANARYVEDLTKLAGPGPYTVRGLPGRGPYRRPTIAERVHLNEIGDTFGCHTCGTRNSGLASGNWFYDHQTSSALGGTSAGRFILPHCSFCNSRQGYLVREIRRFRNYDRKHYVLPAIFNRRYFR